MSTFKPGPGYPVTDFINVPRPESEVERLKRELAEIFAVLYRLVETARDVDSVGDPMPAYVDAIADAEALLSRVKGGARIVGMKRKKSTRTVAKVPARAKTVYFPAGTYDMGKGIRFREKTPGNFVAIPLPA